MMRNLSRREWLRRAGAAAALSAAGACATGSGFFARHRLPVGLQLYTLGDLPRRDLEGTFKRVAAIGFREIELPELYDHRPERLRAAADAAGLRISAVHIPARSMRGVKLSLAEDAGSIAAILHSLGAGAAIIPIPLLPEGFRPVPGSDLGTSIAEALAANGGEAYKRTAALLNWKGAALRREGIELGYHNHDIEFAPIGRSNGWEILTSETDESVVRFEVDVGWIAAAGLSPVEFVQKHAGRLRWMHAKDLAGMSRPAFVMKMDSVEVGRGIIDWPRLLPAAHASGVRHFYIEQEPPFAIGRMEAAAEGFHYLASVGSGGSPG